MNRTLKALLPALATLLLTAFPAAQDSAPTANDIVARMAAMNAQRLARLQAYRSTRVYDLDYRGFPGDRRAHMVVNVTFQSPHKQFQIASEDGSKLLLDRVLHRLIATEEEADNNQDRAATALTTDNYDFVLLGVEQVELPANTESLARQPAAPNSAGLHSSADAPAASAPARRCYVLQVIPKRNHKLLYRGKIWIDVEDFAVARIAAEPAKNPSFWISNTAIEHRYGKYGPFWLPASNQSITKVRLGGRATLTINYGQYEDLRAQ